MRWLSHIFNRTVCIYQTTTRWDWPTYRITFWLINDVMLIFVCLLDDLVLGFIIVIWHGKPVDSNSHRLSPLYYKRTEQTSVLVTQSINVNYFKELHRFLIIFQRLRSGLCYLHDTRSNDSWSNDGRFNWSSNIVQLNSNKHDFFIHFVVFVTQWTNTN